MTYEAQQITSESIDSVELLTKEPTDRIHQLAIELLLGDGDRPVSNVDVYALVSSLTMVASYYLSRAAKEFFRDGAIEEITSRASEAACDDIARVISVGPRQLYLKALYNTHLAAVYTSGALAAILTNCKGEVS